MTNYENLENLWAWLDEKMRVKSYDREAVLEEIKKRHGEIGSTEYELKGWETVSGHAETYSYDYSYEWDEENDWLISETYSF